VARGPRIIRVIAKDQDGHQTEEDNGAESGADGKRACFVRSGVSAGAIPNHAGANADEEQRPELVEDGPRIKMRKLMPKQEQDTDADEKERKNDRGTSNAITRFGHGRPLHTVDTQKNRKSSAGVSCGVMLGRGQRGVNSTDEDSAPRMCNGEAAKESIA
jgi:hypothetical protein